MSYKKIISFIVAIALLSSFTVNATYSKDTNIVAKRISHTVSQGLVYTNSVEIFENERQEIFTFEYTPESSTKILPAYGQYIYGFNSVGSLISSYDGEGRVVGGINTDFFITSTGIPLSCLVSEKEVISTCENRAAIGFDEIGNAIIGYPKINAKIYSEDLELPVAHINKVPAVWGMYLVTDKFYKTTKSSLESIEIIFRPFDKEKTYENFEITDENEVSEDNADIKNDIPNSENVENTESDLPPSDENNLETDIPEDVGANTSDVNTDTIGESNDANDDEVIDSDTNNDTEVTESDTSEIDDDEVNEQEKESAETSEEDKTSVLEKYIFTEQNAEVGTEIDVVITDIFDGVTNSEIPEGSFVLCIPKEQFGYKAEGLKIGDEFKFNISADEMFLDCMSIFGAGSIILKDGEFVSQSGDSMYYTKNPRTAAGIKADGSVVFICIDGRRKGDSEGVTIRELSDYLCDMGCTYAVNFDGGGSTTFYAADIGEPYANLKNTPSEGVERRVADGMIFVNTAEPTGKSKYAAIYPDEHFVYYKDASESITGKIGFADENYYPLIYDEAEIALWTDENYGAIENGIFTPMGDVGKAEIFATLDNGIEIKDFSVGHINITDKVDKIDLNAENSVLSPFDIGTYLSVEASLNTIPVAITPYSAEWDISIETVDSDGEVAYKSVGTEYALFDIEKMLFVPFVRGEKYFITATMGDFSEQIEIFSEEFPYADMRGHWAAETSYDMFKKEFITGELDINQIRNFIPDRLMTRAEFCVVLARVLGLDIIQYTEDVTESDIISLEGEIIDSDITSEEITTENPELILPTNFADVPEWAKPYVSALYKGAYIDKLITIEEDGSLSISANDYITRNDVIRILGVHIETEADAEISIEYTDYVPENDEDKLLFEKIITAGIITGYEDGTIRQNGNLTRAEAATIFSRFYNVLENQTITE